ncbi:MAG TPA: hypothetical protein DDZ76_06180 [Xanthomonadales bacterium]|nr:hypothetical protein [Xanthomonadales bacterium]
MSRPLLQRLRAWITRPLGRWAGIALVLILTQTGVPWFVLHSHLDADHLHDHAHSLADHRIEVRAEHSSDLHSDRQIEPNTLTIVNAASELADVWHVHDCGLTALALPVLPHALFGSPAPVPLIIGDPPATVRHAPLATPYRPPILS